MLHIGTQKHFTFDFTKPFLLLDDGPIIDSLDIPHPSLTRKVVHFDYTKDRFDILDGMNYQRACDVVEILRALFPAGQTTLTREEADHLILEGLLANPKQLSRVVRRGEEPGEKKAKRLFERLQLSPVLSQVLTGPTNISLDGVVLARLPRAELGDFDALAIGLFLMSVFKGQVVVSDGGFYLRPLHMSLIRQARLTAGLTRLSEVKDKDLREALLSIPNPVISHCTYSDAVVLADYAGLAPDPLHKDNPHTGFIKKAMGVADE